MLSLIGPKGSGKSEVAKYAAVSHRFIYTRFADPLKGMLAYLLRYQGLDDETINRMLDGDLKETPTKYFDERTPRHVMQMLGTEWRDMVSKTLWSNIWHRRVQKEISVIAEPRVIVDDNRFIHEYHRIKQYTGSKIIAVRRDGCIPGEHQSEKEFLQIPVDFTIDNNGTLADLHRKIDKLFLPLLYSAE